MPVVEANEAIEAAIPLNTMKYIIIKPKLFMKINELIANMESLPITRYPISEKSLQDK